MSDQPSVQKIIYKSVRAPFYEKEGLSAEVKSSAKPNGWENPYHVWVQSKKFHVKAPFWEMAAYHAEHSIWATCMNQKERGLTFIVGWDGCTPANEPTEPAGSAWRDNGAIRIKVDASCVGTPGNDGLDGFPNVRSEGYGLSSPVYTHPAEYDPNDCEYKGTMTAGHVPNPDTSQPPQKGDAVRNDKDDIGARTMPVNVILSPAPWTASQGNPQHGDLDFADPSPASKDFAWDIKHKGTKALHAWFSVGVDSHYCE